MGHFLWKKAIPLKPVCIELYNHAFWPTEKAKLVKELATMPDDLRLIPGSHMVKGENSLTKVVLWQSQKEKKNTNKINE